MVLPWLSRPMQREHNEDNDLYYDPFPLNKYHRQHWIRAGHLTWDLLQYNFQHGGAEQDVGLLWETRDTHASDLYICYRTLATTTPFFISMNLTTLDIS
ncbi:uncharacterized protein LOC144581428 isoform X2 [Callithrix jacchus]